MYNIRENNDKRIRYPKSDRYLETDPSTAGWGANLNGININVRWSETDYHCILIFYSNISYWICFNELM